MKSLQKSKIILLSFQIFLPRKEANFRFKPISGDKTEKKMQYVQITCKIKMKTEQ